MARKQLADRLIKKNSGVFLAEMRLWTIYFAMPFCAFAPSCLRRLDSTLTLPRSADIVGFCLLGVAFQNKLSIAAVIFGWGMAEFGILILTVATYAYLNNCFPTRQGEVSALINLARTLGGFAIPYYQVPWSLTGGPKRVFGLEAGVGAALFIVIVIPLQFFGPAIRRRFSVQK